jgi:putative glutamine amidotransferase
MVGKHPFHMAGEKYLRAVRESTDAVTVLVPSLPEPMAPDEILGSVDGLLFPGSPSNVSPRHYGGDAPREGVLQDPHRDSTTLPLLKEAIAHGVPTLCICRGFQELNVALGGTLHQLACAGEIKVNSLHSQGIDRLAPTLHADAVAPDDTIEAVSMPEARGFLLGVQWHPEWRWNNDPASREIFAGFAAALRNSGRQR